MASFGVSQYGKYVSLQNNSGSADATAPLGGVYLFASGTAGSARLYMQNEGGTITDLAKSLDIDAFSALGGTGLAQSDNFVFSDGGTEKKVTFSNLEDAIFGNVSGDAKIAAGGALTLANDSVESGMLNDNVISGQTELAHADIASADELMISDGGTLKKVGLDSLRDHYYGQVSGDATIADGGALTIGAGTVHHGMLNDDIISGQANLGGTGVDDADEFMFSDAGTVKALTGANLYGWVFSKVSGDATVAAGGALTIAADSVENSMLANISRGSVKVGGASDAPTDLDAKTSGQILVGDGTDVNSVAVSGDVSLAANGAVTIANDAVESGMLNDNVISGQTELAQGSLAAADELMISDGGTLKKYGVDSLAKDAGALTTEAALDVAADYILFLDGGATGETKKEQLSDVVGNMAGNGLAASSGVLAVQTSGALQVVSDKLGISGSFAGSGLAYSGAVGAIGGLSLDIDNLDALGGTGLHQTQDYFAFSDNGTEKKITFSNLQDAVFADVSGDATIAAGGALTIAAGAVEGSMLADDCISAQSNLGGVGVDDADEFMLSDAGTLKALTGANLYGWVFGKVSGDATVAAGGALTIANDAVEQAMIADDAVGADQLAANAVVNASIASNAAIDMDKLDGGSLASSLSDLAQGDLLYAGDVDDSNNLKSITFSNLEDAIFGNVSGDATIAAGGALTIANDAVEQAMIADDAVGADQLAANAVVNASVASNAAIEGTKLNLNVDMGGNFQIGSQSDDVAAFGGPIKVGGDSILDSGNNGAITFDGSGNTQAAGALTVGTDGGGKQFTVHGAAANEFMRYIPGDNLLKFQDSSSGTILTLGGDATSEYAVDVTEGSNNINKIRAAAFVTYSDESLKQDVQTMNTALDTVMSLNGVEFTWKNSGERDFGFIAQDVQAVLPKAVHVASDGVQGVDYSRLTSVLVEAVKAQQVQIEELKALLKK